ncbi:MAG: PA0069 family radical SAM protein [Rhodobacteraceae bacterium]|nr:PA0069 family radical SAM protein [Paracoccaceae bacterium]
MPEPDEIIPADRRPGRASSTNATGRFERHDRVRFDDGWAPDDDLPPARTEVTEERPRQVLTRNTSPDISFDRSINPYRGCEHGCIYCFARPTHAYLGLSPGLDFETRLIARPDAHEQLARELARKSYRPATVAIGTNTDPYQPIEKGYRLMRRLLEVLEAHNHPVGIVTKGTLIERDIDILSRMASRGLVNVGISVTTMQPDVVRAMEPRVPAPKRRIETIRRLSDAGIPVRICASPMIPGLTDHEIEALLEAGAEAGARAATYIMLRLPREVAGLFRDWIEDRFPDRAAKVMRAVRDSQGGTDYDPTFGQRMRGQGVASELLNHRFKLACKRLGLAQDLPPLRTDLFAVPPRPGDQLSLF